MNLGVGAGGAARRRVLRGRGNDALTRRDDEDYDVFIRRAGVNPLAHRVKLADLHDNCDLTCIPHPTPEDHERVAKYRRAITLLEGMEEPEANNEERDQPGAGESTAGAPQESTRERFKRLYPNFRENPTPGSMILTGMGPPKRTGPSKR
jgi:hypothetical protein